MKRTTESTVNLPRGCHLVPFELRDALGGSDKRGASQNVTEHNVILSYICCEFKTLLD